MTINTTLQKLSYVLRFYRRKKSISQNDMSELLGISTRNYQRLELGEVEPKLDTLSKISKILEVPMSTFFDLGSVTLLPMNEFAAKDEIISANNLAKENKYSDLIYAKHIIDKDKAQSFERAPQFQLQIHGTNAHLNDSFASLTKIKNSKINVDDILIKGSIVDRWEMAFRLKLKSAVYENYYMVPAGFKAFQIHHFNMITNPDNPSCDCYLRDITDRYNLEVWMKSIVSSNAQLNLSL